MELQLLYYRVSTCTLIFILFFVYRYVYGFSIQRIKKWIIVAGLLGFVLSFLGKTGESYDELLILYAVIVSHLLLFLVVPKKRFRHIFWFWPLVFTVLLPYGLLSMLVQVIFGNLENDLYESIKSFVGDITTLVIMLLVWKLDGKYHFTKRIKKIERYIIGITSTFLGILTFGITDNGFLLHIDIYPKIILWILIAAYILIVYIMIRMLIQGNTAQFYLEISRLNEKYIEEEVRHFEAYKKMQEETRKLRHDMKNHLACIKILMDQEKSEELKNYIEELNLEVAKLDVDVQTNNSMVDAIISSKKERAKEKGIMFAMEGNLLNAADIKAIDWCKIFANALDNAIEALEELHDKYDRTVYISIKQNTNFLLISFENACKYGVIQKNGKIVSRKIDQDNHGFGIDNIKSAVGNYGGDVHINWIQKEDIWQFTLEILLPLNLNKM
ncbi:sensor histidine kinase [Anaerosacchariphilus polymeriproducens]|uniref:ATP-binding protein n=1 Tax=Anaerosacchariphilus polymeriproducens TaxID=1812858 RepID=A0A371ASJ9_9FIRM|nr:sensor histidine kinase [Anaerosacchariphilus polymeriproducens]RDU22544.1 ATP-binding protein [Anaerosacchariphilus polymeriproducens]